MNRRASCDPSVPARASAVGATSNRISTLRARTPTRLASFLDGEVAQVRHSSETATYSRVHRTNDSVPLDNVGRAAPHGGAHKLVLPVEGVPPEHYPDTSATECLPASV